MRKIKNIHFFPNKCSYKHLSMLQPELLPLKQRGIQYGGIEQVDVPYDIGRINPDFHGLVYTVSGKGEYITPDSSGKMSAGQLGIFPAGSRYRYWASGKWEICWIHLLDIEKWQNLKQLPVTIRPFRRGKILFDLMNHCINESLTARACRISICKNLAEAMGIILETDLTVAADSETDMIKEKLEKLWELVISRLGDTWDSDKLADMVSLSRTNFFLAVKKYYNATPGEILTNLRMSYAKQMLQQTKIKMENLAKILGYESRFTFSRAFKNFYRCTPAEFRKKLRTP